VNKKTDDNPETTTNPAPNPQERAKEIGKAGEDAIYKILEDRISSRYKILRNLHVPKKNGKTTEIDALVISGRGIYVIESKNRSGTIYGKGNEQNWTQWLNKKSTYPMYNPIMQNESHINALKAHLKNYPDIAYFNIVSFIEGCKLKVTDAKNAYLVTHNELNKTLDKIANTHKDTITDKQREEIIKKLSLLVQPEPTAKEQHAKQFSTK
jgi:hypothetical protein